MAWINARRGRWWRPHKCRRGGGLALYYFHLTDGHQLIDAEGREVGDVADLGQLALRESRAMISQDALSGRISLNQYIEIRDSDGKLVQQLAFRDAVTIGGPAAT